MIQSTILFKSVTVTLESDHMLLPLDDSSLTMKFNYPKVSQLKIWAIEQEETR